MGPPTREHVTQEAQTEAWNMRNSLPIVLTIYIDSQTATKSVLRPLSMGYSQWRSQDFHQGGAQLEKKNSNSPRQNHAWPAWLVIGGWVREGDVPSPAEGGSFRHF